jgi:hypothetical protein
VILFARPTSGLDWIGLALSLLGIFVGSVRARPSAIQKSDVQESA